jgi:hypothetical protein
MHNLLNSFQKTFDAKKLKVLNANDIKRVDTRFLKRILSCLVEGVREKMLQK